MAVVLLCSQSTLLRRNLSSSLRHCGHRVLEADGSIALISACLTQRVDVVLIDSTFDFLSAPDAIRCLRFTPHTQHIHVIAFGNDAYELPDALNAGADHAMMKPIETPVLMRVIERLGQPVAAVSG